MRLLTTFVLGALAATAQHFEGPGKLDPAKLKSLGIADITAASGGAPATNTIWIGKVETLSN